LRVAVYAVFESKKYAECTPGVNDKTDLVVLRNGVTPLSWGAKELQPLEEVYREMRPPELSARPLEQIEGLLDAKARDPGSI
jgi:hypothetical protein